MIALLFKNTKNEDKIDLETSDLSISSIHLWDLNNSFCTVYRE